MTEDARRYLVFYLGGALYALDLAQIAEVGEPPVTWPIPGAPKVYAGAMNFHGSIVAVIDLASFLELFTEHPPEKLIVLSLATASLAFLVDRVMKIIPSSQVTEFTPLDDTSPVVASFHVPEGIVTLLDASGIIRMAEETINGNEQELLFPSVVST